MGIRERFMEAVYNTGDWASPVFGMDRDTYHNFLMRALSGDENVPASVLTRVKVSLADATPAGEGEQRKWWTQFLFRRMIEQHLEDIDGLIARYREMAEWHREQAEAACERMTEAADRLAEIDDFISGVNDLLEEKARTGKFDREKAIELLRARGVEVDANEDEQALLIKLKREQERARKERASWSEQYEDAGAARSYHEELERENRRKAEELVERRDAIRDGGFDAEEEERRLRQVADEYRIDIQTRAFEIEKQQEAATESSRDPLVDAQESIDSSQIQDEEADFLAAMDDLTTEFAAAATIAENAPGPDPTPTPKGPAPGGPSSSA